MTFADFSAIVVSWITPVTVSFMVVHCMIVIINFSILWAFFDRYSFVKKRERFQNVCLMTKLFMGAMFGIFALPGVLSSTSWPKYGFKLWFGELGGDDNPWVKWRLDGAANNVYYPHEGPGNVINNMDAPAGRCMSIWPKRIPHEHIRRRSAEEVPRKFRRPRLVGLHR